MDKSVGFIGLGVMGTPMALNIINAGFDVHVYNRSPEKTRPFQEKNIPVGETPGDIARNSDIVIIMVTGPDALLDILEKPDGVLSGLTPGTIVMNMTTVSHKATMQAADLVSGKKGLFLDVPVSGTRKPAEDGSLVILAGGDSDVIEEIRPILKTMGKDIIFCGEIGQATQMKLVINLLLGSMMEGLSEALTLGKKMGLAPEAMLQTIQAGGLASMFYQAKGKAISTGNFNKNFSIDLMLKDLNLALDAGEKNGVPLPQTAITREMFSAARARGFGDEDMSAVIKVLEQLAGSEVRD